MQIEFIYDSVPHFAHPCIFFASHFTGKERDSESGNDYFGARYYASTMGRFMSPDWSAQAEPVPYAKLDDPQSLNLYAYVRNNPLVGIDPDGHFDCGGANAGGIGCQTQAAWQAINNGQATAVEGYMQQHAAPQQQSQSSTTIAPPLPLIPELPSVGQMLDGFLDTLGDVLGEAALPLILLANPASTASEAQDTIKESRKNPFTGKPGETTTLTNPDGTPKQVRRYGPDGYPQTDVDYGHDHTGAGDPHAHDWGRPADGSPPTAKDRGVPRPLLPTDPQPQ